jgi:polar amino acid transport system substrate-binding protein
MSKLKLKIVAPLLTAVALVLSGTIASARDMSAIVIGYGEWPPYESNSLPDLGPVPALVGEAFAAGGTHVEFRSLPWWRMLREVELGNLDGALIWRDIGDRRTTFLVSDPIFKSRISLFYRKNEIHHWTNLSDLSSIKIGATASYRYCPEFDQLDEQGKLTVERAAADDLNFSKLQAHRIDAMIVDSEYGRWRLKQLGDATGRIVEDKRAVCITPMHLLISRAVDYGPALAERFNTGLQQMKANGRFDQLFNDIEH